MCRYRTIVADPPWPMNWNGGGKVRRKGDGTVYANARAGKYGLPYRTMTVDDIAAITVDSLAADAAHLYLWATDEHLLDGSAVRVAKAWGFRPERLIIWRKPNGAQGHGWRPSHEVIVMGRRGALPFADVSLPSVGDWKQTYVKSGGSVAKLHSAKPEAFLDLVEQASPGPYLEMFARRARFGWDYYGDESLGTASLPGEDAA